MSHRQLAVRVRPHTPPARRHALLLLWEGCVGICGHGADAAVRCSGRTVARSKQGTVLKRFRSWLPDGATHAFLRTHTHMYKHMLILTRACVPMNPCL